MALLPGARLGPYEIVSPLGAGGMGEVYRARDTRLDRTVAESRERFQRETRIISSLSHPNICTLYDVGSQDGIDYAVMEYLEGQALAQRLEQGPMPLDSLLTCAIEIAAALAKAHREGVAHRDLKPGNIMLTKSGAKLLDFGLAKAVTPVAGLSTAATRTAAAPITAAGSFVGTCQYMAPRACCSKPTSPRPASTISSTTSRATGPASSSTRSSPRPRSRWSPAGPPCCGDSVAAAQALRRARRSQI